MPAILSTVINFLLCMVSLKVFNTDELTNANLVSDSKTPILLWHGMGDSYNSTSMQRITSLLKKSYPLAPIHSIALDEDNSKDQQRGIVGDAMSDIESICATLLESGEFKDGVDAIGFSQGGLFLRALVSTCDIKVNNLVTFGSPHQGFSDLPACDPDSWNYWFCSRRNEALKSKMYSDYFQNNNIQAQYFRDNLDYQTYLEKSAFLKWINNDLIKDLEIWDKMIKLENFVMVLFEKDVTLVPKESAWFQDLNENGDINGFLETETFKYDSIGLKTLHSSNKLHFESIDDFHCAMTDKQFLEIINKYIL